MRMLSIRVRSWCVCWAYAQGTGAYAEHTRKELTRMLSIRISFLIFQTAVRNTLSICVRNSCVSWGYTQGTDAHAEHTHKELMRVLCICVWNWRVYATVTDAYAEHTRKELYAFKVKLHFWDDYFEDSNTHTVPPWFLIGALPQCSPLNMTSVPIFVDVLRSPGIDS